MLVLRGMQDDDGARRVHEADDKVLAGKGEGGRKGGWLAGWLEGTHGPTRGSRLASYDSLLGPTVIGPRDKKVSCSGSSLYFLCLPCFARVSIWRHKIEYKFTSSFNQLFRPLTAHLRNFQFKRKEKKSLPCMHPQERPVELPRRHCGFTQVSLSVACFP